MSIKVIEKSQKEFLKFKYNRYNKKIIVLETISGWTFLSPLTAIVMMFSTASIAFALYLSLHKGTMSTLSFVGFDNWKKIFIYADTIKLDKAFANSFKFAIISVPIQIGLALIISGLLNSKYVGPKTKQFYLAVFFLPLITSGVASTLIFSKLVSQNGIIKIDPIRNPNSILYVAIAAAVWQSVANSLVLMNTAFGSIDKNQYEAAEIDGATPFKKMTRITIPSIFPVVAFTIFTSIIGALGVFDAPFMLATTSGIDDNSGFITLILAGYDFIQHQRGGPKANIGLGTAILFLTAIVMASATVVINFIFPINAKR